MSVDAAAALVGRIRNKGVRLWFREGKLRYRASKGSLTREELEGLRNHKDHIVALLKAHAGADTFEWAAEGERWLTRAPLTYQQLAHWNLLKLDTRPSTRDIAFTGRLLGQLNVAAFRSSVAEVVRRHDALRTRIVIADGEPAQEIVRCDDFDLQLDDLSALPEYLSYDELNRLLDKVVLAPVDFASGPLFGAALVKLGATEHVVLLAMDHMISDRFSLQILIREVFEAYGRNLQGDRASPATPLQFPEHAFWQRNNLSAWLEQHGRYWDEHLKGCDRMPFPADKDAPADSGWAVVPIRIGSDLKEQLHQWRRPRRTTLAMTVFAAYVGLVLRWCRVPEGVVQYQTTGRDSAIVENTIGYFASALCLRVGLRPDDTFTDLIARVTDEYCSASEHADYSYLAARHPRPDFARNTLFNWFAGDPPLRQMYVGTGQEAIEVRPMEFANPGLERFQCDHEPEMVFIDQGQEVIGGLYYPANRFSAQTMERFAGNFLLFIQELLRNHDKRIAEIPLS